MWVSCVSTKSRGRICRQIVGSTRSEQTERSHWEKMVVASLWTGTVANHVKFDRETDLCLQFSAHPVLRCLLMIHFVWGMTGGGRCNTGSMKSSHWKCEDTFTSSVAARPAWISTTCVHIFDFLLELLLQGHRSCTSHCDVHRIRYLLRFLILHLIESDLAEYMIWHNNHRMRHVNDRPDIMFEFPERAGKSWQGLPVDESKFAFAQNSFPDPNYEWYPPSLARVFQVVLEQTGKASVNEITRLNWKDVVLQCKSVLNHMDLTQLLPMQWCCSTLQKDTNYCHCLRSSFRSDYVVS